MNIRPICAVRDLVRACARRADSAQRDRGRIEFPIVLLALAGGGCANYYDWPVRAPHNPGGLYSNLGEKRSATGDGPTWLNHGATDFVAARNTPVFSPDTGRVEFYNVDPGSPTNAGIPPLKIGRFAMLHFHDATRLEVNPNLLGDPNAWTYVVNPGDPIWVVVNNRPEQRNMPRRQKVVPGVRQDTAGQWGKVFWFNRNFSIGEADGPDLHTVYYTDADAPYNRVGAIGNMLTVIEYKNPNPPECVRFRLFAAEPTGGANKDFIADDDQSRQGGMQIARHRGVDVVATCSSFKRSNTNRAGIYKLAYGIHRILRPDEQAAGQVVPGPGGRRMVEVDPETVMWEYLRMPDRATDPNLVASPPTYVAPGGDTSLYGDVVGDKYTAYTVSNTGGDDARKWALDDLNRYPDAEYVVTVRAWNIAKSNGIGTAPDLADSAFQRIVSIETDVPNQVRLLWIRNP